MRDIDPIRTTILRTVIRLVIRLPHHTLNIQIMEITIEVTHLIPIMGLLLRDRDMILDYPHAITRGLRMGVARVICDIIPQAIRTITIIHHRLCIILIHQLLPARQRLHRRHRVDLCRQVVIHTHLVNFIRDHPHPSLESLGLPGAAMGIIIHTRHMAHLNHIIRHTMVIIGPRESECRIGNLDRIHRTLTTNTTSASTTSVNILTITKVEGNSLCLFWVEREGQTMKGFHQNCTLHLVRIGR